MYQIIFEPHEVYEFAAEELARYYAKITGEFLPRYTQKQTDAIPIYLGSPGYMESQGYDVPLSQLRYDGYVLTVTPTAIFITGKEKRSILYGVYRLLETAGCKWMFPGPEGEQIPHIPNLKFAPCEIIDNPDFEVRASCDDTHRDEIVDSYWEETLEKFDWACKNRLNSYYGGVSISGDVFAKPLYMREITKRDFMLEAGGHAMIHYVDKSLFDQNPELFRMKDGVRRADGNFCSMNPQAVQMVVDGIGNLLEKVPSVKRFHIWFDDTFEGSWCDCEKCKDLTPAMQCFNVVRAVANAFPQLAVDFLLYHDSEDTSSITETLPPNVSAEYAPRERCYAHSIADTTCHRNKEYYQRLLNAHKIFPSIYPFEYYGDMILFNKMGVNLQHTIAKDFSDYKNLGVNAIKILMFNRYSWFAYKLNMVTFARCAWNLSADVMKIREELCRTYYGNCAEDMMKFYRLQEEFTNAMFEFCGYTQVFDIRNITPLNQEFGEKHLQDMKRAKQTLAQMEQVLENAVTKAESIPIKGFLNQERICLQFTAKEAEITRRFMEARHALAFGELSKDEFNTILKELMANRTALGAEGESYPNALVGINGKCTFPHHLCGDLNNFYGHLKNTPTAK